MVVFVTDSISERLEKRLQEHKDALVLELGPQLQRIIFWAKQRFDKFEAALGLLGSAVPRSAGQSSDEEECSGIEQECSDIEHCSISEHSCSDTEGME